LDSVPTYNAVTNDYRRNYDGFYCVILKKNYGNKKYEVIKESK
jgi:hypothetical protein